MAIFSFGNRKLPKSVAIFNLPRLVTCRDFTSYCKQVCYARKAERSCFPAVVPQRTKNYYMSLRYDFFNIMTKEISGLKQNIIRIHESGDFYNQAYLEKWFEIMNCFPEKTFLAYSKSVLDYKMKPNNFILFFSMDKSTPKEKEEWYRNNPYKNAIASIGEEYNNCPGNCKKHNCLKCYSKASLGNVVFKLH